MKKLPIDMCVFRRLQLTVVCVSEASINYVNIVYVPPFRYNTDLNLTLFLWLNKLQVIHRSRYQINGKKIFLMFRRLQLFRRLQWLTKLVLSLFSNSADYLNYLLTSDLGFHMLHFDILIGWVPVLIFVQTGWIVLFRRLQNC